MGFLFNGTNEGVLPFTPEHPSSFIAWILIITVPFLTFTMLYLVLYRSILQNKRYTRMIGVLLLISIVQQFLQLMHCVTDTPPWWEFVHTQVGILQLLITVLVQLESLSVFSVLVPFWTTQLLFRVRIAWILWYLVCLTPSLLEFLHNGTPLGNQFDLLEKQINAFFGGTVSTYDNWQTCYLLYSIYKHAKEYKEAERFLALRVRIYIYLACAFCIGLVDLTSVIVYLFAASHRSFAVIAVQIIQARVAATSFAFYNMKCITKILQEARQGAATQKLAHIKTVLVPKEYLATQIEQNPVQEVQLNESKVKEESMLGEGLFSIGGGYDASSAPAAPELQLPRPSSYQSPDTKYVKSSRRPSIMYE
jgi:hypothetical protein